MECTWKRNVKNRDIILKCCRRTEREKRDVEIGRSVVGADLSAEAL